MQTSSSAAGGKGAVLSMPRSRHPLGRRQGWRGVRSSVPTPEHPVRFRRGLVAGLPADGFQSELSSEPTLAASPPSRPFGQWRIGETSPLTVAGAAVLARDAPDAHSLFTCLHRHQQGVICAPVPEAVKREGSQMNDADTRHTEKMRKIKAARDRMMATQTEEKGLIIVLTGPGKGKSSSGFGKIGRAHV